MTTSGAAADAARAAFRAHVGAPGHAVEHARAAAAELERAFEDGVLVRTPALERMLADLAVALGAGGKPGGKSPEAARLILRAMDRELERA